MLRNLFTQRHPFLMQAIGGLIALVIFAPIAGWIVWDVLHSPAPQAAIQYSVPSSTDQQNQTGQGAYQNNGSKTNANTGGKSTTPTANQGNTCSSATCTIKMESNGSGGYVFNPASLQIKAGTTLHFVDVGGIPHNIVPNPAYKDPGAPINRSAINAQDYTVKVTQKGTFHFQCQVHLPEMIGQVTVS